VDVVEAVTMSRFTETGRRLVNYPVGVFGRNRPWYFLNVFDAVGNSSSLEDAVAGRNVLVTGASSGIGKETAVRLGAAGATVILVARRRSKLEEVAAAIDAAGGTSSVHECDLTDLEAVEAMAEEVEGEVGGVDVLVNSAGHSIRRSVALSYGRMHDFERTMQLNYFAPVKLVLAFLPGMRERGRGHIVNISSAGVQVKVPRFAAYIASKAALDAFSDCVAAEVRHDGVSFSTIYMPLVRTPMIEPTRIYRGFPAMTPDEAATMVCDAIRYRPRRIGTPVGAAAAVSNAVAPRSVDAVRNAAYRLFPDSHAARGEADAGDEAEDASLLGQVFARLGRGVHW
jgi:short-subunit dehydrogenase